MLERRQYEIGQQDGAKHAALSLPMNYNGMNPWSRCQYAQAYVQGYESGYKNVCKKKAKSVEETVN